MLTTDNREANKSGKMPNLIILTASSEGCLEVGHSKHYFLMKSMT